MPKLIADHTAVCSRCWATAGLDDAEEITLGLGADRPCFVCGLMLTPSMDYHWMPRRIAENERALFRDHRKFVGSIKEEDRSSEVSMGAPSRHRRVRITKCDLDTSWYHGLEGEEFEVCTFGNTYVLLEDYNNRNKRPGVPWRHILVDDCVVLGMLYTAESGKVAELTIPAKDEGNPWIQAMGLVSTVVPDMVIDVDDPIGMAQRVVEYFKELEAALKEYRESH